jgi:hypothetical protein
MPRTIQADGRTITVPDDATPDEINQIVGPAPKPAAPPDTRNAIQRGFDNLTNVTPEQDAATPALLKPMAHFGAGAIQAAGSPLIHPIQTVEGMGHLLAHPIDTAESMYQSAKQDPAKFVGNLVGGAVEGDVGGELLGAGTEALSEPMQAGGGGLIDRAAGSLAKDFKRGAEPGRAYLEGGGTPALTMRGLANKAEAVQETAGHRLGEAYDAASRPSAPQPVLGATRIGAEDVRSALLDPVNRLRGVQNGPGGVGASPLLDEYEGGIRSSTGKDFTPRSLFDLKRNVAANTRWNDPTMFDMNSVRQQGVGAVGNLLTDAVPETAPLNRIYQGAGNLAERAGSRADTGTPPFTSLVNRGLEGAAGAGLGYMTHNPLLAAAPLLMDSVPVKTGAGYLLYQGGKLAGKVPNLGTAGAAAGAASPLLLPQGAQ